MSAMKTHYQQMKSNANLVSQILTVVAPVAELAHARALPQSLTAISQTDRIVTSTVNAMKRLDAARLRLYRQALIATYLATILPLQYS
jgi:hypothetical protein